MCEEEYQCPECEKEVSIENLPNLQCDNCGLEDEYQLCENGHKELIRINGGTCSACWNEAMDE
ncbi:TPA: hypothetical protein ACGPFX_002051 [Bacillus pacificus]|nr:hypothetical protein [Bacillus paranthracis]